ncbi:methyltransferase [Dactylosporangium sp. AC04546]|uniref:acetylserotonin O-methyltransferase n=1 Tax=Dactylosporangium sp. AC04546 TaxID=2862460 RepID=UPI001EE0A125|nr:acetylserotonin O-methyltransferase [Dactylosporangium sp. AC04546]WVK79076.1 methyltransferase [Dactylosporangium sp. AC04546]
MTQEAKALTPERFHQVLLAYCGSKTLMSAVEVDLFSVLAELGAATEEQLRRRLNLHPRFARHFLEALVALELLARDGEQYRNTPLSEVFLDRNKPSYVGGFAEMTSETFYPAWGRLTKALHTGQAQAPQPPDDDVHLFRLDSTREPERVRRFMTAMDSHSTRMGEALAELIDWRRYRTFADLGGARGNLASVIAKAHSHLTGVCFDRRQSQPFFDEHIERLGLAERITFQAGDFFSSPLPEADVLVYGHVLHDWGPDNRRQLLARAHDALRPGGALVVYDRMIDGTPTDLNRLFFSLTFMLASAGGSEYSVDECRAWLREAGFTSIEHHAVLDDHTVVVAYR